MLSDCIRRYRGLVEAVILEVKRNWKFAGLPFKGTWVKEPSLINFAFYTACCLQNRVWRLRGSYLRTKERHFDRSWERWECCFMLSKFKNRGLIPGEVWFNAPRREYDGPKPDSVLVQLPE